MKVLISASFSFYFLFQTVLSQTCTTQNNKDITGNDYYNVQGQQSSCCQICYGAYYCKAYSWTNYNGGTCWLKTSAAPVASGADVVLGIPNAGTCQKQADTDISGQDLININGQPESNCCNLCTQTQGCRAYAWNSFNGGTCWLKSSAGPFVGSSGTSVGVVCGSDSCSSKTKSNVLY